jgi:acyl carrier protein
MDSDILARILAFVAEETATSPERISLETSLQKDIGVDGDDAEELMEKFSETFQVDMKEFQIDKYFYPEHYLVFSPLKLVQWLFGDGPPLTASIRIADLVKAAECHRWVKRH